MILTRDGKEITAIYSQDGSEVEDLKDANGRLVYLASREITGTLPLPFSGRGKPLTDYLISGNTVQNGTPTPEAPVDAVGCGVRTGNLFDKSGTTIYRAWIGQDSKWLISDDNSKSIKMPVSSNTQYTLSIPKLNKIFRIYETNIDEPEPSQSGVLLSEIVRGANIKQYTFTTASDTKFIVFQGGGTAFDEWFNSLMLNLGSTALSYEPYGYKLPPTVNGTEYPIYLGEVESTRRIKKLVLTGEEAWTKPYSNINVFRMVLNGYLRECDNIPICTHYNGIAPVAGTSELNDLNVAFLISSSENNYFYIRDDRFNNANDFKSYLAAQYAAGTPVTIWYVLATPETAVVNEPIHKIGNYADTISFAQAGVTIPTVSGANVLDMTSPVKPSEVYIKGKGIKSIGNGG